MSRGRGRGRGKPFGGNLELLGLSPGQPAPPPILQPPPDFPPLERRPLELRATDVDEYHLTVKQELRQQMKQSHFYLKAGSDKKGVERYSDKYKSVKSSEVDNQLGWEADWNYFPEELKIVERKKTKKIGSKFSPVICITKTRTRKRTATETQAEDDISAPEAKKKKRVTFSNEVSAMVATETESKLNELEKLENTTAEGTAGEEEEVVTEDEIYDEEIEEEGTDYNLTYFDNGEDYLGEEDTLEDNEGPYY